MINIQNYYIANCLACVAALFWGRVSVLLILAGPSKINKTLTLPQNSAATQATNCWI